MNKNIFQAALPTHPVQDNLGQLIVSFGMSKLEYAAVSIAGHIQAADMNLLPETIAQVATELAEKVLIECQNRAEQEMNKQQPKKPKIISLNK